MSRLITIGFIILLLSGCVRSQETLTIFAASSLADAFTEIGENFQTIHPDTQLVFNFAGSSALAAQLLEGASADVFASANESQMQIVIDEGYIANDTQIFARNHLVLIVPANNPAHIMSLQDLATPGVKFVTAAPGVPIRGYTDTMLAQAATAYGGGGGGGTSYQAAVVQNIASEEDNVRQIVVKIALGEADAGIVYQSDVTPENAEKITEFAIPPEFDVMASYPIAITKNSDHPQEARAFLDYVLSDAGQQILVKWGFTAACPDEPC
jgi:molybdate transport system substrate-binding protein